MEGGRAKALLALSWIWLAAVGAYMVWGAVSFAGLYRWLAEAQMARFGGYYPKWTAILPGLLLAAPALWYLRRDADRKKAAQPAGPAAEAARLRPMARVLLIAGTAFALVAGGVYLVSQRLPDGSEPALPFDAATLGTGPAPAARVEIRGAADPEASVSVTESGRLTASADVYAGFRPDGEAKDAPLRLFVERSFGDSADAETAQYFLPEQTGYLVENGLPALALRDLETRGIRVASPHYVLRTRAVAQRELYYVAAALCALIAFSCLTVALALALRAGRLARQA